jgi:hypothetical protein
MRIMACAAAAVLGFGGLGAAGAQEAWVGAYAHDVKDGLSLGGYEDDTTQIAAGLISRPLGSLATIGRPSAYVLTALNTQGGTNYAAAGLSWRIPLGEREGSTSGRASESRCMTARSICLRPMRPS